MLGSQAVFLQDILAKPFIKQVKSLPTLELTGIPRPLAHHSPIIPHGKKR